MIASAGCGSATAQAASTPAPTQAPETAPAQTAAGCTGETLGEQAGTGTFLTSTRFSSGVSDSERRIDSHK